MAKSIRITLSSTPEFERQVQKFLHGKFLKGYSNNKSELYRNAVELWIANDKRKKNLKTKGRV